MTSRLFSFSALNRGDVKDTEMDVMINSMVDSLFAVCVTLGNVPSAAYYLGKLRGKLFEP